MHAGLDHLGVVEHHQTIFRQIIRQVIKHILSYLTVAIDQQFGMVTPGDGKLGNTFVGERILIVADMYMFGIDHGLFEMLNTIMRDKHASRHR